MVEAPKIQNQNYFAQLTAILSNQLDSAYFEALGRFMHEFSQVEQLLYVWLGGLLKLEMRDAAAVFSGVRAAEAIANIKRLHEARDTALPPEIEDTFSHISTLTTARNEIIHYGGEGTGLAERSVSTRLRSHIPAKAKHWPISADILKNMYLDAEKANVSLIYWFSPTGRLKDHPALTRAWLYKYPANPQAESRKGARKDQKKKRQPKGQRSASPQ